MRPQLAAVTASIASPARQGLSTPHQPPKLTIRDVTCTKASTCAVRTAVVAWQAAYAIHYLVCLIAPPHLASGSAQRAIRGHCNRVYVSTVSDQVVFELAVGQVEHLDKLIPTGTDNDGVVCHGAEAHAADPLRVALRFPYGVLAFAKGVPELDGLVTST